MPSQKSNSANYELKHLFSFHAGEAKEGDEDDDDTLEGLKPSADVQNIGKKMVDSMDLQEDDSSEGTAEEEAGHVAPVDEDRPITSVGHGDAALAGARLDALCDRWPEYRWRPSEISIGT